MRLFPIVAAAVIAVAPLLSVGTASAATIVVDDASFGVGTVLRDVTNGREYLRLDLTMGYGYNAVIAEFGVAGDFEGWSVATETMMLALGASSGISHGSNDPGQVAAAEALRDWFCPAVTCVNLSTTHEVVRGLLDQQT